MCCWHMCWVICWLRSGGGTWTFRWFECGGVGWMSCRLSCWILSRLSRWCVSRLSSRIGRGLVRGKVSRLKRRIECWFRGGYRRRLSGRN